ncbi:cytochrome b [Zwartia vadi]|uniref:cytochrome b n=1 Tax=Zwartia vadi TaxID=3058168 RepID=UPI0025B39588|nr:cytochrome b/b6 domain-containing protein [Zwartia vadi]MDN3987499.1 cytochrome b/b6 domain-containing protein [Zwartia vadi]
MPQTYSMTARALHWLTAILIVALIALGVWMTERAAANLWDALTNTLYGWHKLIGFIVLWLTALRIIVKIRSTKPSYPASVSPTVIKLAAAGHGALYLLLLIVPLLGWAGVTAFPALITIGGYHLPAMPGIPKDQALAKQIFEIHGNLAMVLAILALGHIAAALHHLVIKKDGVFQRMWPKN